jgi:hypothetical protein
MPIGKDPGAGVISRVPPGVMAPGEPVVTALRAVGGYADGPLAVSPANSAKAA